MFKTFLSWLTSYVPVAGWLLIVLLFGCAIGVGSLVTGTVEQSKGEG